MCILKNIVNKWQTIWEEENIFSLFINNKKKFYILDMFPYPSGKGLHIGHILGYTISDILSKYMKLKGYNILHPIGFDSFGLPTEQYANSLNISPYKITIKNSKNYIKQLKLLGFSYNWDKLLYTSDKKYYKWTQWIFIQFFNSWYDNNKNKSRKIYELINIFEKNGNKKINAITTYNKKFSNIKWNKLDNVNKEKILEHYRLAYRKKSLVNWCPNLKTVLSNEEIKNGVSERGGHKIIYKKMKQWKLRISGYFNRLLKDLKYIKSSDSFKKTQKKWIGLKKGMKIKFKIVKNNVILDKKIKYISIFLNKLYMIFGISFIGISIYNSLIKYIKLNKYIINNNKFFNNYNRNNKFNNNSIFGIFTNIFVYHPLTKKKIPLFIVNYIENSFYNKSIIGIPSEYINDKLLAKKFNISYNKITKKKKNKLVCINSDIINNISIYHANEIIKQILKYKNIGKNSIIFNMEDPIFSRQRYWGEPIPIYYKNNIPIPIPENYLPIIVNYNYINKKLFRFWNEKKNKIIYKKKNYKSKNVFPLENDTMPSWAGSSWYYLRYLDKSCNNFFINKNKEKYWGNVDIYIGGSEHITGHLIYSRFWYKFFKDNNWVSKKEPFNRIINQGMILFKSSYILCDIKNKILYSKGIINILNNNIINKYQKLYVDISLVNEKNELDIQKFKNTNKKYNDYKLVKYNKKIICYSTIEKMSKSKLNVISPNNICKKYGIDTLRLYVMFLGPIYKNKIWSINNIKGICNFIKKLKLLCNNVIINNNNREILNKNEKIFLNTMIKNIVYYTENLYFNKSISSFMTYINKLLKTKNYKYEIIKNILILLSPYAPYVSEELWNKLGNNNSIFLEKLPIYDKKYIYEQNNKYSIMINAKKILDLNCNIIKEKNKLLNLVLKKKKIKKYLNNKKIINVIYTNKLLNLITN